MSLDNISKGTSILPSTDEATAQTINGQATGDEPSPMIHNLPSLTDDHLSITLTDEEITQLIPSELVPTEELHRLQASEKELKTLLDNISILDGALSDLMQQTDFLTLLKTVTAEACAVVDEGLDNLPKGIEVGKDFWERRQNVLKIVLPYISTAVPLSKFEGLDFSFLEKLNERDDVQTAHLTDALAYVSSFKPALQALSMKFKDKKEANALPTMPEIMSVAMSFGTAQMMSKMNPMNWFNKKI